MKKILLLLLVGAAMVSCKEAGSYHKYYDDFTDNRWERSDKKAFEFTNEANGNYDIILEFSHVYGFQFARIPLEVSITDPSGKTENFPIELKITDDSGNALGSCAGDVCDLNFNIKNTQNLTRGDYKIVISNAFNNTYLPNVIGVGLTVKHSN